MQIQKKYVKINTWDNISKPNLNLHYKMMKMLILCIDFYKITRLIEK